MPSSYNALNPYLETDLWRWLLFESGLSRGQAKALILQNAQSAALSLFWQAGPETFARQLNLGDEALAGLRERMARWDGLRTRWDVERRGGVHALRINEPGYPPSLSRHLPTEQRPLLLFLRGETTLLELPLILPADDAPADEAGEAWVLDTLAELTEEGALALFMAQPGLHARLVKAFLDASIPFVLVIPQGLATYAPPSGLRRALDEERILLISPFQPEWKPPAKDANPLLSHAATFARALAEALLTLTPLQTSPFPQQPCFYPPAAAPIEHAEPYAGPEALFLRLVESGAPAASIQTAPSSPPNEPELEPISPESILETLTQGGRVPPALAARLRQKGKS
ncbi:MAG TPA: hypothetical protein EYP25_10570 [Anaerolineae bacterium]|nr:hypothetical protein [Caldilineae bacterium]HID34985.1 hypothetical protein [Anaerolineae bacterium]